MRIGIVCPYTLAITGGVQMHVLDMAKELRARGHHVSVLAPTDNADVPPYVYSAGHTVKVRFNGSVAPIACGPWALARTVRWLDAGNFDVVHIHEPFSPSVSLIALLNADCPVVATFHAAIEHSRIRRMLRPILRRWCERMDARIAVSAEARRTLVEHEGGDAVIIPNGVDVDFFTSVPPRPLPYPAGTPVVAFMARLDERRKGLGVLAPAIDRVLQSRPDVRFLIAGPGTGQPYQERLARHGDKVEFIGPVYDTDKVAFLRAADIYIAPQTGGESFGIVLIEAMSAGCAVIATDLTSFSDVLAHGELGTMFPNGNSEQLAEAILDAVNDPNSMREQACRAQRAVRRYDWGPVTDAVVNVYEAVRRTDSSSAKPAREHATVKRALVNLITRGRL